MSHRMISTRRQIVNEQDRYGGYQNLPAGHTDAPAQGEAFAPESYAEFRHSRAELGLDRQERSYQNRVQTEYAPQREPEYTPVQYSQRPYQRETEYIPVEVPETAAHKTAKRRNADEVMPTIKNHAYVKEVSQRPAAKLSASAKTVLIVYIVAIVVLSVVVIATGVAINTAQAKAEKLQSELTQKIQLSTDQSAELSMLSDPVYVAGLAVGEDMVKIGSYQEVPLMEIIEPKIYESETNWFDSFCEWLSGFFGG